MLGVDLNLKDAFYSAFAGAKNEALGKIPMYNYISTQFRRYQANQKLKGPKTGTNTVDEYEFHNATKSLHSEIAGSLNPFRWIWGLIQSLLGNTKSERIVTHIQNLEAYGGQHDGFKFANKAQETLLTQIEHRIDDLESLGSKYLGTYTNKVNKDPVLKALKAAIQSWLEPFDKIINGEVVEISKLGENDINFLKSLRDRIQYSPRARYMEDMLPRYNEIILEAERALYSNPSTGQAHHRRTGQKLARTAA